ncbi:MULTISPECIES: hypothetical protein [Brasilonema]|uniref:hypothetical protein n=1 Tax=Brasilonema TaxID=383614 RepID=UPI001FEAE8B6|nr:MULTISPECIES: hypothetical protein [Brasilonema]
MLNTGFSIKRSPPILPSEEHYIKAKRQVLRYLKSDKKPKYLSNRERWHLAQLRVGKTPEEWGYLDHGYEALTEPTLTSFLLNGEPLAHITRNSYGLLCLNSPQVMFVDIDLVPSISPIRIPVKPGLKFNDWCEVRIVPTSGCFVIEIVYEIPDKEEFFCSLNPELAASIDIGLDNLATIVFNEPTIQPIAVKVNH